VAEPERAMQRSRPAGPGDDEFSTPAPEQPPVVTVGQAAERMREQHPDEVPPLMPPPSTAAAAEAAVAAAQLEATSPQKRRIAMLAKSKLGITDSDLKALWLSERIGRPIKSSNELTFAEAKQVIDSLERIKPQPTLDSSGSQAGGAEQQEQLFQDLQAAIIGAPDSAALQGVYEQAVEAQRSGRITAQQFAQLDQFGQAAAEDFASARQPVGAAA
jgi:hypothetical protein